MNCPWGGENAENYFVKLLRYMKNVYHIDHGLSRLTDRRVSPKYKTPQVILITLLALQLRIKSVNELKYLLKENAFKSIFSPSTPLPQIDTIIDTLKSVDVTGLKSIQKALVQKYFCSLATSLYHFIRCESVSVEE